MPEGARRRSAQYLFANPSAGVDERLRICGYGRGDQHVVRPASVNRSVVMSPPARRRLFFRPRGAGIVAGGGLRFDGEACGSVFLERRRKRRPRRRGGQMKRVFIAVRDDGSSDLL